jgi:Tfp pilus assembly protein PilF
MLAKTYFKLDNYEKARENLETVILLDPLNIEADILLNELKYK